MYLKLSKKTVEEGSISIAGGGRYDYLAKQLGSKKDIPAVGFAVGKIVL